MTMETAEEQVKVEEDELEQTRADLIANVREKLALRLEVEQLKKRIEELGAIRRRPRSS